jgi:hypothetical protein
LSGVLQAFLSPETLYLFVIPTVLPVAAYYALRKWFGRIVASRSSLIIVPLVVVLGDVLMILNCNSTETGCTAMGALSIGWIFQLLWTGGIVALVAIAMDSKGSSPLTQK